MADIVKRYVAVDLGTSCGKVVLATVVAGTVKTETVHSFPIPSVRISGQEYWDIYAAYGEVLRGLAKVGELKKPIESIGIDAWTPGIVCVAKDGSILGLPGLSVGVLSDAVQAKFFKRMERRELYEATGVNVLDSHAALQLFGLRRAKSVALDDAKYLFFIPEAVSYLLTGKRYTEFTSLSAAGLVDRRNRKVSRDVLSACKVRPRRFPSVVLPGVKLGKLTEYVAQATGLGRVQVVAVAGHDLASAAAALPAFTVPAPSASPHESISPSESLGTAKNPSSSSADSSSAFLRLGPVCEMGVNTASPIVNDQTFEMNFSNEAGVGGTNLLVKRIVGSDLLRRCLEAWRAAGRAYGPEDLARMAREGAPVAAQLDPEDPALRSASDAPAAIARFCSLRSMEAPGDNAATVRLICTSMAEKIGDTFVKLQSVTPFRLKSLTLIGDILQDVFSASPAAVSVPGTQPASPAAVSAPGTQPASPASLSASASHSASPSASPAAVSAPGTQPAPPAFRSASLDSVFSQMIADECAVPVTVVPADAAVLGNILVQSGVGQPGLTPQALAATYTPVTFTPGLV